MNTPTAADAFAGFLHTDVDTTLEPLPVSVLGVLSLVDVNGETDGFQCVPELFHHFKEWKQRQPADRDGFRPTSKASRSTAIYASGSKPGTTAALIPLGRKLLGADPCD